MKKVYWLALVLGFALSCTEETPLTNKADELVAAPTQRACASYEVLQEQIRQDPARGRRLEEIEAFISKVQVNPKLGKLVNGVIEIPVWVNVIYNKAAENISVLQIQSQIDVLNEDFNATNSDYNQVPTLFSGVKANVGIRFVLQG
ncbi:MAG: zinc metalloprotease, partial [Bacteroidota bacterium]